MNVLQQSKGTSFMVGRMRFSKMSFVLQGLFPHSRGQYTLRNFSEMKSPQFLYLLPFHSLMSPYGIKKKKKKLMTSSYPAAVITCHQYSKPVLCFMECQDHQKLCVSFYDKVQESRCSPVANLRWSAVGSAREKQAASGGACK